MKRITMFALLVSVVLIQSIFGSLQVQAQTVTDAQQKPTHSYQIEVQRNSKDWKYIFSLKGAVTEALLKRLATVPNAVVRQSDGWDYGEALLVRVEQAENRPKVTKDVDAILRDAFKNRGGIYEKKPIKFQ